MKTLRNLALAGTVAVAAVLSAGAANATPASALQLGVPAAQTESAATPVYFGYYPGGRLCHVPFFKLVQWFGYWRARAIKHRCYYYNNYYSYYALAFAPNGSGPPEGGPLSFAHELAPGA